MAGKCQPAAENLISFNSPQSNNRQSLGLNRTRKPLPSPMKKRCGVDQLLDWSPEQNKKLNIDDLLSYSPPPLRRPELFLKEQPGIVHNLAQLNPDIRVQSPTQSPRKQSPTPTSSHRRPQYGPHLAPPEVSIQQASPQSNPCGNEQCTPISWVDRNVRHKSNILGGDEENRARWTDIQLKFSFLKNAFDHLYSGLLLNLSEIRPPNQPWALRPEPQKFTYEDGFREYPSDILNLYLDNWTNIVDDENDFGQDSTILGVDGCNIETPNVEGNINMGGFLEYEPDEDKECGEVNVSIKVLESKCIEEKKAECNEESDESDVQVCSVIFLFFINFDILI